MSGREACAALALAAFALAGGCAFSHAERLPWASDVEREARGAWITLWLQPGSESGRLVAEKTGGDRFSPRQVRVGGELLAVGERHLYLRAELVEIEGDKGATDYRPARPPAVRIERAHVRRGRLEEYQSLKNLTAAWTVAGSLSTASHGGFAVFSLPIWLLTGIVGSAVESRHALLEFPAEAEEMKAWARFPQGIVPGLDEGTVGNSFGTEQPAPAK